MAKRKYLIQIQAYSNNPLFCTRTLTDSKREVDEIKNNAINSGCYYRISNRLTGELIESTYPEDTKLESEIANKRKI